MIDFINNSLIDYLDGIVESDSNRIVQCKIPVKFYDPKTICSTLKHLESKYGQGNSEFELSIKISQQTFENWNLRGKSKYVDEIKDNHQEWISERDNLTYYRNEVVVNFSGKKLLLFLVGTDLIDDVSSLEHVLKCDVNDLWSLYLEQSFNKWLMLIKEDQQDTQVSSEEIEASDILLKVLNAHVGLVGVSDFLSSLSFDDYMYHGMFRYLATNLNIIGFASLTNLSFKHKKVKKQITECLDLWMKLEKKAFALDEVKLKNALNKISKLKNDIINKPDDKKIQFIWKFEEDLFQPSFSNASSYLEACERFVSGNADSSEVDKLRKCDFFIFCDKVLKYKSPGEPSQKTSEKEFQGNPLEVVLSALWDSFSFYYKTSKAIIRSVEINATNYSHQYTSKDSSGMDVNEMAKDEIQRIISGLDDIINKNQFTIFAPLIDCYQSFSINCNLLKIDSFSSKPSSIPCFHFDIVINDGDADYSQNLKYCWKIKPDDEFRVSSELLSSFASLLRGSMTGHLDCLPVLSFSRFDEVYSCSSTEEIRSYVMNSFARENDNRILVDLMDVFDFDSEFKNTIYYSRFCELNKIYSNLITKFGESMCYGIYNMLESDLCIELIDKYYTLLNTIAEDKQLSSNEVAGLLMKAFWIVKAKTSDDDDSWYYRNFLKAGILTIIHPAMMEMMQAQSRYLQDSFGYCLKKSMESDSFKTAYWDNYLELATIQSPIPAIMSSKLKGAPYLSTEIKGSGLFYVLGNQNVDDEFIMTTKVSQADFDSESLTDQKLVTDSKESKRIAKLLMEFYRVHNSAHDHLTIGVFNNTDIQPVVAAVNQYIDFLSNPLNYSTDFEEYEEISYSSLSKRGIGFKYSIKVFFYCTSRTSSMIPVMINKWYEYWYSKKESNASFGKINLFLSYRVLDDNIVNSPKSTWFKDFEKILDSDYDVDITLLYDLAHEDVRFAEFKEVDKIDITEQASQFPILEKLSCVQSNVSTRYKIFSNRQFPCYRALLRYYKRMKDVEGSAIVEGNDVVIREHCNYDRWLKIMNFCHFHSERVVCIGSNIDRMLIEAREGGTKREIIGFGSGIGAHADLNYTVSSDCYRSDTVIKDLTKAFKSITPGIEANDIELTSIIHKLYNQREFMSGLSMVKAVGSCNTYKHDYFGYALTRLICNNLKGNNHVNPYCDLIVPLDSYDHWFMGPKISNIRPDLLRLLVLYNQEKNRIEIKATVIECKYASNPSMFEEKAIKQVVAGYDYLSDLFVPVNKTAVSFNPNSRYWWMQLYRLISSNVVTRNTSELNSTIGKLEKLTEGDFEIQWDACIFEYYGFNDNGKTVVAVDCSQELNQDGKLSKLIAYRVYPSYVKQICLTDTIDTFDEFKNRFNISQLFDRSEFESFENNEPIDIESEEELSEEDSSDYDETSLIDIDISDNKENNETSEEETEDALDLHLEYPNQDYALPNDESLLVSDSGWQNQTNNYGQDCSDIISEQKSILNDSMEFESLKDDKDLTDTNENTSGFDVSQVRAFLGYNKHNQDKKYFWEFGNKELKNRHMVVFGSSGGGKSYAVKCVLCELSKQQIPSLIIDYTEGFKASQLQDEPVTNFMKDQVYLNSEQLPLDPFIRVQIESGSGFIPENESNVALRVASVFKNVYENFGEQQFAYLRNAIISGIKQYGDDFSFDKLKTVMENDLSGNNILYSKKTIQTLCLKMNSFMESEYFKSGNINDNGWKNLFENAKYPKMINTFQLTGIDSESQKLISMFILWDLWNYLARDKASEKEPRVVLLDEFQNLKPDKDGSPVIKYLKEGRKMGLSLILATQTLSAFSKEMISELMQASTKLFFIPSTSEMKDFADLLSRCDNSRTSAEWSIMLANLKKGECILIQDSIEKGKPSKALSIKIASYEERGL